MNKLHFDDPYWSVEEMSPKMKTVLKKELLTEITKDHILHNRQWIVIARRMDNDDVIIELSTGEIAVVHLTWSCKPECEGFPRTTIFRDKNEFRNKEMNSVILNHNS